MTTMNDLYAALPKDVRNNFHIGTDITPKRYSTPSVGLNLALGGGFGGGRIVTIHGTKSAGKSAFCLQTLALAQQHGAVCAWIDAEKAYDSTWAQRLGVNTDELLVSKASDMERAGDEAVQLTKAGADIIVVDSGSALIQPSYMDKSGELAGMASTKQIGSFSKGLKALLRSVNYENDEALVILIMQESMSSVGQHFMAKAEGGKAIEYYSSQIVRLVSNNSEKGDLLAGEVYHGDRILNRIIGRTVHWSVEFNKLGPQSGRGDYEFYFQGGNVGIDDRLELITLAVEYGIIDKAGAWLTFTDSDGTEHRYQGAAQFRNYIGENVDVYGELKENVTMASAG